MVYSTVMVHFNATSKHAIAHFGKVDTHVTVLCFDINHRAAISAANFSSRFWHGGKLVAYTSKVGVFIWNN